MGAVGTHTLIQKITVGSAGTASVTFSSIPATYTDLYLKLSLRSGRSAYRSAGAIQFNADTGVTRYSYNRLYVSGTTTGSDSSSSMGFILIGEIVAATSTASTFTNTEVYIPQYTSSNAKSVSINAAVEQNDATNNRISLTANLYNAATNAAITSIKIFDGDDPASLLQQYSSVSLYGVTTSSVPASPTPQAQGGDIIVNDGTYWYHAFISTGAFVPKRALTADVLVVAGGGGGGGTDGGGGGSGGAIYFASQTLTSGAPQIATIGAGGNGGGVYSIGTLGINSSFGSFTAALGGGRGGGGSSSGGYNGTTGGSGAGGAGSTGNPLTSGGASIQTGTGATAYYGFAGGGGGADGSYRPGGGGGGTGAVGANYSGNNSGNGGAGINTYSSWLSATGLGVSSYIAGGGGGGNRTVGYAGTGGSGGGGNGGSGGFTAAGTAGTTNTGSGGGGGPNDGAGGAGGSGVIIIRYKL